MPEPSQESEGHIYVLGPLYMAFIYTYMNAHFAGLIHAPQQKMTGLSMLYKNGQHKYHTANKKWRG